MSKQIKIIIYHIFEGFFLAFFMSSLFSSSDILNKINIVLLAVVFKSMFSSFENVFVFGLSAGITLDSRFMLSVPLHLIAFIVIIFVLSLLFHKILTNKSLYAFLAGIAVSILIFNSVLFINNKYFINSLISSLKINLALGFLIFYLSHFFNKKLRPVFIR